MVVFWRDPVTSIYTAYEQHEMSWQLGRHFDLVAAGRAKRELGVRRDARRHARRRAARRRRQQRRRPALGAAPRAKFAAAEKGHTGRPLGRIQIKRIGLSTIVVENTDYWGSLSKGPGRYEEGSFPGLGQTTGIAGHRTTFAAPFRHIDSIRIGDSIVVQMPYGTFTYRVLRHKIVDNGDWSIMNKVGFDELVLSACHPLYSAASATSSSPASRTSSSRARAAASASAAPAARRGASGRAQRRSIRSTGEPAASSPSPTGTSARASAMAARPS